MKNKYISYAIILTLIVGFTVEKSAIADNNTGKGALGGALAGAAVGGLAGGGRGAGIGAIAGLGLGAIIGAASSKNNNYDPYAQLNKYQREYNRLQEKLAKANPGSRKAERLERQINWKMNQINNLKEKLTPAHAPLSMRSVQ